MEFTIIDAKGRELIKEMLKKTDYNGCEYLASYQNAWISRDPSCLQYAAQDGIVYIIFHCIHQPIKRGELLFLPPLTTADKVTEGYLKILEYAQSQAIKANIIATPHEHIELLPEGLFECEKVENMDEYLYATQDLVELSGKKYHAKRNHIAKFKRQYKYVFRDYVDGDKDKVMQLLGAWQEEKNEYETREEYAINNVIEHRLEYGVNIGILEVDDKVIAFSISEVTANNRGVVHFEKADISYDGSYAAINNFTAATYLKDTEIINRQEDMGIEGLRKAKLSYYPIGYCEKWLISEK